MSRENGSIATNSDSVYGSNTEQISDNGSRMALLLIAAGFVVATQGKMSLWADTRKILVAVAWLCPDDILSLIRGVSQNAWNWSLAASLGTCSVLLIRKLAVITSGRYHSVITRPALPPLIFPCHTTHTRFFPSKHSFTYSYLLVGIPVGWRHTSGFLACDSAAPDSRAWSSVHNEDYLARGTHSQGLRGKLDEHLAEHGILPHELPHAYLVTAPRFLGWSFNPVSFWYLYDPSYRLRVMILEVNNTFDERRMYLLKPDDDADPGKFRHQWAKDFHVSPFNDRTGDYSVVAIDPFQHLDRSSGESMQKIKIDNNITLSTDPPDAKPKLVARIFSTSTPLDPSRMSLFQFIVFMCQWGLSGFLTNPRILWEARILWAKKKLQLFYRPEVNVGSIGRQEQKEEVEIERHFRGWLEQLARRKNVLIEYTAAAGSARGKPGLLKGGTRQTREQMNSLAPSPIIRVEVLTPEWYAELARAPDLRKAFERCCFAPIKDGQMLHIVDDANATISGSSKESLNQKRKPSLQTILTQRLAGGTSLLAALLETLYTALFGHPAHTSDENRSFRDLLPDTDLEGYDRAALLIVLADKLALGYTGLLRFYWVLLHHGVLLFLAWTLAPLVRLAMDRVREWVV